MKMVYRKGLNCSKLNNMKQYALLVLFLFSIGALDAQKSKPAFYKEIQAFKKEDSAHFPTARQILFIGSSSFTRWRDIKDSFPGYPILNRGFGGSTLTDQIHYARDIIVPYKPKQVVIYCGENDLASSDTVSAEHVLRRFEILFYLIRKNYPKLPIAFISIKPSPSRQHLMPKFSQANTLIKQFLARRSKTTFVDVYHRMLNADGTPMAELFVEDSLHMNARGYAIWQEAIAPHLLK